MLGAFGVFIPIYRSEEGVTVSDGADSLPCSARGVQESECYEVIKERVCPLLPTLSCMLVFLATLCGKVLYFQISRVICLLNASSHTAPPHSVGLKSTMKTLS